MTVETVKDIINGHIKAAGVLSQHEKETGEDFSYTETKILAWKEILKDIKEYERDEY